MSRATAQDSLRHYRGGLLVLLAVSLAGCTSVGYYYQSVKGHLDLMCGARPIDEILKDDDAAPAVRRKLERVAAARRFASERLHLPDNDSYRSYADLEREYAIWNVFAAPVLSVEPHRWCFPIVGCVVYRGYFEEADARRYARSLRARGLETFVAGVPAYSTLGWFDDPVLNTVLHYPEAELAGLIFHELAHQVAYAKGDSVFNESFATTVEMEGVERWLKQQRKPQELEAYRVRRQRDSRVIEIILEHRDRLAAVYTSGHDRAWKLEQKARVIASLKERYRALVRGWDGYRAFGRWFAEDLNNAHFVAIAAYHDKVAVFQALLARHGGNLASFYEVVVELSEQPAERRNEYLESVEAGMSAPRVKPSNEEGAT